MGKAYANKKKKEDRPIGDFYVTPKSLIWAAEKILHKEFGPLHKENIVLEPACGNGSISNELKQYGFSIVENDLFFNKGQDYLLSNFQHSYVITNPPFSLWDEFVLKAKTHCKKFMLIGRLNYLGTQSRHEKGIWKNLKAIYPFSRYVDFQTQYRKDGFFHVGAMATGWFLWDMEYTGKPTMEILDVQKYAKLGAFKNERS